MARKDRQLPALPASAAALAEGGRPDVELAGWLHALLTRAEQGDEQAGNAVLQACREVPKLWELLSVLAGHAERAWVDLLAAGSGSSTLARRTIEEELKRRRAELAAAGGSPLEVLLIERVVLCWLASQQADAQYARKVAEGMSFREGEYYGKRCEQASRQLLRSIEALARVRRLLGPSLQINIGQNQLNVAP